MANGACYLHVIEGRMRVHVPGVKDRPRVAVEVERYLGAVPGVSEVRANPVTGNVLVRYDEEIVGHQDLLHRLEERNYCSANLERVNRAGSAEIENPVAQFMVHTVVEVALKLAISALL
ncbi:MAG: HMA2 domain-containing protein [Anaerolineae bacterium]